jgi:hypothetical protein
VVVRHGDQVVADTTKPLVLFETPLLSGDISYTPAPLEPPDAGQVLICCAQPSTDIVLDM